MKLSHHIENTTVSVETVGTYRFKLNLLLAIYPNDLIVILAIYSNLDHLLTTIHDLKGIVDDQYNIILALWRDPTVTTCLIPSTEFQVKVINAYG